MHDAVDPVALRARHCRGSQVAKPATIRQRLDRNGNCPIDTAPEWAEHPSLSPGFWVYFLLLGVSKVIAMSRESAKQFAVDPNIRCAKVYPVIGSSKSVSSLKTVGIKLTRAQAVHLAQVLLAVAEKWDDIDVTAYRDPRQSDSTHHITVTSLR